MTAPAPAQPPARSLARPPARSLARPSARPLARPLCRAACTLLGAALALAACAPGAGLKPLSDYSNRSYQLGGGDQVRIITYGEDQLTGEFRVDDQGNVALPLIGAVAVAGLSPEQMASRIADELRRRKLLHDPSVSVEVLAYRPIFVLGEVAHPGQYPYQPGMTMLTAVAVAGGFTYRAVQDYAADVRTADPRATPVEGRITPLSLVAPGDVVNVLERRF